jgi:hypothetical protein
MLGHVLVVFAAASGSQQAADEEECGGRGKEAAATSASDGDGRARCEPGRDPVSGCGAGVWPALRE